MMSGKSEYARSAQMASVLRTSFLYSEKRARDCVFAATETVLVTAAPPPTLATLIRSTLQAARDHARLIQYELLNSETVTRAVFNAMLRADVLLSVEGKSIRVDLRAYATRVRSLAPDFRTQTEAFLLEFLIGSLGDVGTRDHLALAHVLFRQFDPNVPVTDLEDRLVTLLAAMDDRIQLSHSGLYSLRAKRSWMAAAAP
jgi:hypothetical protein